MWLIKNSIGSQSWCFSFQTTIQTDCFLLKLNLINGTSVRWKDGICSSCCSAGMKRNVLAFELWQFKAEAAEDPNPVQPPEGAFCCWSLDLRLMKSWRNRNLLSPCNVCNQQQIQDPKTWDCWRRQMFSSCYDLLILIFLRSASGIHSHRSEAHVFSIINPGDWKTSPSFFLLFRSKPSGLGAECCSSVNQSRWRQTWEFFFFF